MSYVRWSTPLALPEGVDATEYYVNSDKYWNVPTSDFYIYDHVGGFVSVNIAGNRHRPTGPFEGPRVIDVDPETHCGRGNPDWFAWLNENREEIDHPDAGQTFEFEDMADAIAKVEELIGEGFLAPDWLLDEMREELTAQGIEAAEADETRSGSAVGESPVAEGHAPIPPHPSPTTPEKD